MVIPKDMAVGDLTLIWFFFLLSVGEYTQKRKRYCTHMIQFRFCDIVFKKGKTVIPLPASTEKLIEATTVTIRLNNQKNGMKGSFIHCSAVKRPYCPVKALVRRFIHLRTNKTGPNEIISAFLDPLGVNHATDSHTGKVIKNTVRILTLDKQGVGTHFFRAGGAMALNFAGTDHDNIKKLGQWSSDMFMIYIHDQIVEYSKG